MDSVSLQNLNNIYKTAQVQKKNSVSTAQTAPVETQTTTTPNFRAYTSAVTIRTTLANKDERKKYEALTNELDLSYRKKLEFALKSGQLLKNNSNDKSTVLDNLHKIITEDRDPGLD